MRRGSGRNRLFYRLFISYAIIVIIPVFVYIIFIQTRVFRYFESEMGRFHEDTVAFARTAIDNLYSEALRTGFDISSYSGMDTVLSFSLQSAYDGTEAMSVLGLYRLLEDKCNQTPWIHSIYVYSHSRSTIISLDGTKLITTFGDTGWIREYRQRGRRVAVLPVRLIGGGRQDAVQSVPVVSIVMPARIFRGDCDDLIAVNIHAAELYGTVEALLAARNSFTIADETGRIVYSAGREPAFDVRKLLQEVSLSPQKRSAGLFAGRGHEEYLVLLSSSAVSGLSYLASVPVRSLFESLASLRVILIIISLAIMATGLLVSYVFSMQLYRPLYDLLRKLGREVGTSSDTKYGELAYISHALDRIIENDRRLMSFQAQHAGEIESIRLLNLVQSEDISVDSRRVLRSQAGLCVIAAIDRYKEFTQRFSDVERHYLWQLILTALDREISPRYRCHGLLLPENRIVMLVEFDFEETEPKVMRPILESVQRRLMQDAQLSVSFGVGDLFRKVEEIPRSRSQGEEALQYRLLRGHATVIFYHTIPAFTSTYLSSTALENRIVNRLSAGTREELIRSADEMMEYLRRTENLTVNNARLMVNQILGAVIRYLDNAQLNVNEVFRGRDIPLELSEKETIQEIGRWLADILLAVYYHKREHSITDKRTLVRLVDFLHTNMTNPALDITLTAQGVGITYSKVRTLLQEHFGTNYIDYLNTIRTDIAKHLLTETDLPLNEIAARCGYANAQALNRFFKKYEGVTPGRFRTAAQVEKSPTDRP